MRFLTSFRTKDPYNIDLDGEAERAIRRYQGGVQARGGPGG